VDNRDNLHDDIPFYIECAEKQRGEILELGCGTGRVALVLAEKGFRVTGLVLSRQMLDIFCEIIKAKPESADKITLVHGNMADFCFDRKFALKQCLGFRRETPKKGTSNLGIIIYIICDK